MKIKLDENLPTRLVRVLEERGYEVHPVATEGLTDCRLRIKRP
jgi:predicted nuclease of predicted toxin-antitoxin system